MSATSTHAPHGTTLLDGRDGIRFVKPSGSSYQPCVDFIRHSADDKLILWLQAIPDHDAVAMLLSCDGVEHVHRVHVQTRHLEDPSRLSSLHHLRTFGADDAIAMDFRHMARLWALGGVWSEHWQGLEHCTSLRSLHVSAFQRKSFESLPLIEQYEDLTLIQTRVASLRGLEQASKLTHLSISHASALVDISALGSSKSLRRVEFDGCRKIHDFSVIGQLEQLELLSLHRCGTIASLGFIRRNVHLRGLGLIETRPADLDLSPCMDHPTLRHFGATAFRGATPSVRNVEKALEARSQAQASSSGSSHDQVLH
ncbi:hypothetical protein [Dyella sp. C11]|uniref:hypothetical protein n=1 Tax=Dyella sp. C11 TaxID=2126991 RepID=UPI0013002FD5|nr:hypothetical protein [Dyella sp. C11]